MRVSFTFPRTKYAIYCGQRAIGYLRISDHKNKKDRREQHPVGLLDRVTTPFQTREATTPFPAAPTARFPYRKPSEFRTEHL